jgi:hypothetical protein
VWGLTATHGCRAVSVWPAVDTYDNPDDTSDKPKRVKGNDPGTWVSKQTGGPSLCGKSKGAPLFAGGCPDTRAPVSRYLAKRAVTLGNRRLRIRGRAHDKGCKSANLIPGNGHVKRVDIDVAKIRGSGTGKNCRYLRHGRLAGKYGSCSKPKNVRAHYDKTRFQITFAFPPSLPKGQYLIRVRATDTAGNREQPPKRFHLTYK